MAGLALAVCWLFRYTSTFIEEVTLLPVLRTVNSKQGAPLDNAKEIISQTDYYFVRMTKY